MLIGGGGADILFGGGGNDIYRVEEAGDVVVEGAGGGADSVYAVTSYTLAAGSEVELLSAIDPGATAAMDLTGNEFANRLYGNAGANTLIGGGGGGHAGRRRRQRHLPRRGSGRRRRRGCRRRRRFRSMP